MKTDDASGVFTQLRKHSSLFIIGIIMILFATGSCTRNKNFSLVLLSDLHYDSTSIRETVLDSVIISINNLEKRSRIVGIRFVAVLGDLTQDGGVEEWERYTGNFGLNGEADLIYPVYEIPGNHDGNIDGVVRSGIRERNMVRKGISRSENNLHYSWDESGVHFAALGIYPGLEWDPGCDWCGYFHESYRDPEMSLEFLEDDLEQNLQPGQPVIIFIHYGWDGFSMLWWTEDEQQRFYDVICKYNVAAVFHGHDHTIEHYRWKGIDVWSAGSPQAGEKTGSYLTLQFENDSMHVFSNTITTSKLINSKVVKRSR